MLELPKIEDLAAYRQAFDDESLWQPVIAALCAELGLADEPQARIPYGSSIVYAVGSGLILKLFCPLWQDEAQRELDAAIRLAPLDGYLGVALPKLVAHGRFHGWPYLLSARVEGSPACEIWDEVSAQERVEIARQLGQWCARLHALEGPADASFEARGQHWISMVRGGHPFAAAQAHELWRPWAACLQQWCASIDWPPQLEPHWIHADLTDDNMHFAKVDGRWRLVGVFDFGDAMYGGALYELGVPTFFLWMGHRQAIEAMLEGYGWRGEWEDVLMASIVTHQFNSVSRMIEVAGLISGEPSVEALRRAICG